MSARLSTLLAPRLQALDPVPCPHRPRCSLLVEVTASTCLVSTEKIQMPEASSSTPLLLLDMKPIAVTIVQHLLPRFSPSRMAAEAYLPDILDLWLAMKKN